MGPTLLGRPARRREAAWLVPSDEWEERRRRPDWTRHGAKRRRVMCLSGRCRSYDPDSTRGAPSGHTWWMVAQCQGPCVPVSAAIVAVRPALMV